MQKSYFVMQCPRKIVIQITYQNTVTKNNIFYISGEDIYIAQLIKQYMLYFENLDTQKKVTEEDIIEAWNL